MPGKSKKNLKNNTIIKSTTLTDKTTVIRKKSKVAVNRVWNGEHFITEGTFKRMYNLVPNPDGIPFTGDPDKYVVLRYKSENFNARQVLDELNMCKSLGDIDCSAKIVYCYNYTEDMTFNVYLKRCNTQRNIIQDMKYIIEKLDCGSKVFDTCKVNDKIDYTHFFKNLRSMLGRLVSSRTTADGRFIQGYYNTDIKPENLGVVPDTTQLKMIDLDNDFVRKVHKEENSNHYLIYMLFQVYTILNKSTSKIDIKHTGITKKEYDDMIKFIYGIAIKGSDEEIENEKHDACFMLSYYTNQQVKNDYNDDPRKYNTYRTILSNTQWFDRYITGNFYTLEMINPTKRKRTTNKTEKDKEAEEVDTKKTIEDELSYSEVPMQDPCTIS